MYTNEQRRPTNYDAGVDDHHVARLGRGSAAEPTPASSPVTATCGSPDRPQLRSLASAKRPPRARLNKGAASPGHSTESLVPSLLPHSILPVRLRTHGPLRLACCGSIPGRREAQIPSICRTIIWPNRTSACSISGVQGFAKLSRIWLVNRCLAENKGPGAMLILAVRAWR